MRRFSLKTNAKGLAHLVNGIESGARVGTERFIERLSGDPRSLGDLAHTAGAGSTPQGMGQLSGIAILDHHGQVGSNIFFVGQMACHVEIRHGRDMEFFGVHGLLLDSCSDCCRLADI